jgi:hypothetical protein
MPEGNEGECKDVGRSESMRAIKWNVDVAYESKGYKIDTMGAKSRGVESCFPCNVPCFPVGPFHPPEPTEERSAREGAAEIEARSM